MTSNLLLDVLLQAIGVIMRANIGTVVADWILVLEIHAYELSVIGFDSTSFCDYFADRLPAVAGGGLIRGNSG